MDFFRIPCPGTTMFAKLLQQRVVQLSTRLQLCNRRLLQQTSPCPSAQRRMQATCSHHMWQQSPHHHQGRLQTTISSNLSSCNFHSLVGMRRLQQDTTATTSATEASSPIPDPSSGGHSLEDAAIAEETAEGSETLFEDEHERYVSKVLIYTVCSLSCSSWLCTVPLLCPCAFPTLIGLGAAEEGEGNRAFVN